MDTQEFISAAREYAAGQFPKDKALTVSIRYQLAGTMEIPIPALGFEAAHGGLKENELLLFGYIPEPGKPEITANELMKKTGYKSERYIMRILRRLMKKSYVAKGEKGYVRTR